MSASRQSFVIMVGLLSGVLFVYIIGLILISIEINKYRNTKMSVSNSISNDNECVCTNAGICKLTFEINISLPPFQADLTIVDFKMAKFCANLIACIEAPWAYGTEDKNNFKIPNVLTKIKDIYYEGSIIGYIVTGDTSVFVIFKGTTTSSEWKKNFEWSLTPFAGISGSSKSSGLGLGGSACSSCANINNSYSANIQDGLEQDSTAVNRAHQTKFAKTRISEEQKNSKFTVTGQVHSGWLDIYNSIEQVIIRALNDVPDKIDTLVISGHSLGAALSTLLLADNDVPDKFHSRTTCYVFGSPRVGDEDFANSLQSAKRNLFRIQNENDIVTQIPLSVMVNFKDPKTPYLYSSAGKAILFKIQRGSFLNNHSISCYLYFLNSKLN
jgi:hypothetical protein